MTTPQIVITVLGFATALGFGWVLFRLTRKIEELQRPDEAGPALLMMQQQLDALREQVRVSLESGRTEIDRRLEETQRVVGDVRRGLGEVRGQVQAVH